MEMGIRGNVTVGSRVRSYDFGWHTPCFIEGTVTAIGPWAGCPCGGDHVSIRVERVVWEGVAVAQTSDMVFPAANWCWIEEVV